MTNSKQELEQPSIGSESALHSAVSVPAALAICSAGWLVPGLGHVLLGRWIRGLIFALSILVMFGLGLAMHGKLYDLAFEEPLQIFAFIANIGAGAPYFVAEKLDLGVGAMTVTTYDYGSTYLWVAGLLNYLIVLDAFDIARGRKRDRAINHRPQRLGRQIGLS